MSRLDGTKCHRCPLQGCAVHCEGHRTHPIYDVIGHVCVDAQGSRFSVGGGNLPAQSQAWAMRRPHPCDPDSKCVGVRVFVSWRGFCRIEGRSGSYFVGLVRAHGRAATARGPKPHPKKFKALRRPSRTHARLDTIERPTIETSLVLAKLLIRVSVHQGNHREAAT